MDTKSIIMFEKLSAWAGLYDSSEDIDEDSELVTKLLYQEKYDIYQHIEEMNQKQDNIYLNWKSVWLDTVIRKNMFKVSNILVLKGKKVHTPNSLKKDKIIDSGQYSDWKAYIKDTEVERAFGIEKSEYQISGIKELMEYPKIVLLLIGQIFPKEDWDEIDKIMSEEMYFLIKKILSHLNDKKIELSKKEINRITRELGGSLYPEEYQLAYLEGGNKVSPREKDNKIKVGDKKEIAKEVFRQCKILKEKNFITETSGRSKIKKKNNKMKQLQVSAFFVPLLVTMCRYYKESPFLLNNPIWKNIEHEKFKLDVESDDETKERISENYSELLNYISYADNAEVFSEDRIYIRYRTFLDLMIFNIYKLKNYNKKGNLKLEDIHFLQYCMVEDLMGFKFVEEISYEIKKQLDCFGGHVDEMYLSRNHSELGNLLRNIYECNGLLSRVDLGKQAVKRYFEYYSDNLKPYRIKSKLLKSIDQSFVKFDSLEALFLGEQESVIKEQEENDWKTMKEALAIYLGEEKEIRRQTADMSYGELSGSKDSEHIAGRPAEKIKEFVEKKVKEKDCGLLAIESFVVCYVILKDHDTNVRLRE